MCMNYEGFQIVYQIVMMFIIHVIPRDVNVEVAPHIVLSQLIFYSRFQGNIYFPRKIKERGRPAFYSCYKVTKSMLKIISYIVSDGQIFSYTTAESQE